MDGCHLSGAKRTEHNQKSLPAFDDDDDDDDDGGRVMRISSTGNAQRESQDLLEIPCNSPYIPDMLGAKRSTPHRRRPR
jgi:hypothetical protein